MAVLQRDVAQEEGRALYARLTHAQAEIEATLSAAPSCLDAAARQRLLNTLELVGSALEDLRRIPGVLSSNSPSSAQSPKPSPAIPS
jgi:hypothetical protein